MSIASRFLAIVTVSILVLACDRSPTGPGEGPVAFVTVVKSSNSGFLIPRQEMVRSAEAWESVWDVLFAGQSPVPPRPTVDFEREMVALAAMGSASNGCFRNEVTAVDVRGPSVVVEVTELEPAANCACTTALTQPVHVVRLDRIELAESFVVRRRTLRC